MRSPKYKTGDVVRYIDDMASVLSSIGNGPKIILKSSMIELDSPSLGEFMYDLLDGDRQTKMWERWLELV